MNKQEIIANFDPNGVAVYEGIFGLPFNEEQAEVIILPVPWDVSSSYSAGSANGPEAILEASFQVDLFDPFVKDAWKLGVHMLPVSSVWKYRNDKLRLKAEKYIAALEKGSADKLQSTLNSINRNTVALNQWVEETCAHYLNANKQVVLLGGDHSTPLGYIKALAKKHKQFSILQIDAHADLRIAYEDFKHSHASIMYNVLEETSAKLTQVGIRDYCEAEAELMETNPRIHTFFDRDLKHQAFNGTTWAQQVKDIIDTLKQKVYLSFDIDGLDPKLCPNTGTPVPGGFEFEQITYLLEMIVESGRTFIGMDLNEVAPGNDEWDANVGARMLFRICNLLGKSQGLI